MMTSQSPDSVTEPVRFTRDRVVADPGPASTVRADFGRWLRRCTALSETRLCDVVLAVNEALANAVEFAYVAQPTPGQVDVEAVLDPARQVLTVTIRDEGCWRDGDPFRNDRSRGRGIVLMRTLADALVIDTSALGTSVVLRFDGVDAGCPDAALTY